MSSYTKIEQESNPISGKDLRISPKISELMAHFFVQKKLLQPMYIIGGNLTVIFQFIFLKWHKIAK